MKISESTGSLNIKMEFQVISEGRTKTGRGPQVSRA